MSPILGIVKILNAVGEFLVEMLYRTDFGHPVNRIQAEEVRYVSVEQSRLPSTSC